MKRLITAAILIPLIVYLVLWAHAWAFLAVLATVGLLCFHEYSGMVEGHGDNRPGAWAIAAGLALLLAPNAGYAAALVAMLAMAVATLRARELNTVLPAAGAALLGVLYVFGSWRCAAELRWINPHWLMFALAINWVGDTAAMYAGKALGRNKLAPHVSPGKTWEGSLGSIAGSLAFAALYARFLEPAPLWQVLLIAAAGNVAGQIGDLCESALKRGAHLKDSSTLLPGHGGWLDRVDSSLFSVPLVYFLVRIFG
ncbi:MAG: phosphatidate cytidylyltransferase [Bryobacteraceae bacterium]|nr:phosphatidate cytidylyltransferase [Bryobacteraceae bacterium]